MNTSPPIPPEEAFTFACEGETLVGVLHRPAGSASTQLAALGVVVIVGGPQYRAGSHRQFVRLARALAAAGHPVLRFDVRGMGDSTGPLCDFEQITPDIGAAIDSLVQRAPAVERVVLWGLCDGASAALLYLHDRDDTRVHGLCLLNPWVRSEETLARTHVKHYYLDRLLQASFWAKLLTGRIGLTAVTGLVGSLRATLAKPSQASRASYQQRMLTTLKDERRPSFIMLSSNDYVAREFDVLLATDPFSGELWQQRSIARSEITDADHTLSSAEHMHQCEALTIDYLKRIASRAEVGTGPEPEGRPGSARAERLRPASDARV